ncbi:formate dehydrogenase chain D [Vibrio sp. JCM 19236]|nr:formate dehydrogenase chain D [Vibrio sp. JCM 19236]
MAHPSIIKTSENPMQTIEVEVFDEYGEKLVKQIACERPLTVMLNWKEVVTLMTLGSRPESLVLGYLKNQGFISDPDAIESLIIDWETSSAAVITKENIDHIEGHLRKNRYLWLWSRHHVRQRDEAIGELSGSTGTSQAIGDLRHSRSTHPLQ